MPTTSPNTTAAIAFTGAPLSQEWIVDVTALLLGAGLMVIARRRRRTPNDAAE